MALTPERIDAIAGEAARLFGEGQRLDAVVRAVKAANPGLYVAGTQTSVMAEEPFREEERFSLFLVDGSQHCWVLTGKPEVAAGILIAERDEDL